MAIVKFIYNHAGKKEWFPNDRSNFDKDKVKKELIQKVTKYIETRVSLSKRNYLKPRIILVSDSKPPGSSSS